MDAVWFAHCLFCPLPGVQAQWSNPLHRQQTHEQDTSLYAAPVMTEHVLFSCDIWNFRCGLTEESIFYILRYRRFFPSSGQVWHSYPRHGKILYCETRIASLDKIVANDLNKLGWTSPPRLSTRPQLAIMGFRAQAGSIGNCSKTIFLDNSSPEKRGDWQLEATRYTSLLGSQTTFSALVIPLNLTLMLPRSSLAKATL